MPPLLFYTEPSEAGIMTPHCAILDKMLARVKDVMCNMTEFSRHAGSPFYTDVDSALLLPPLLA